MTQDSLTDAFNAAPRERFLPTDQVAHAHRDTPLPIGFSVTCSQPTTVANMLALLDAQPGNKVLDVGSGSGWTSALLAEQVGSDGTVVAVERIPELVQRSKDTLKPWPQVSVNQAVEGVYGLPQEGPFDRILVSAMAREIPESLVDQLAAGGTMVIPVASVMLRICKDEDGTPTVTQHGLYSFVPLLP